MSALLIHTSFSGADIFILYDKNWASFMVSRQFALVGIDQ